MKKTVRIIACVLILCMVLSFGAMAVPAGYGLNAFETIADMTNRTFSDVQSSHWAYNNVKDCYDKGILYGYPDGSFGPERNITWAEAITVAARIHATYYSNVLRTATKGEAWFTPEYNYCKLYDMLPPGTPTGVTALSYTSIPRYDLAYLFARTVNESDMPLINDSALKDMASVPAVYKDSVKLLSSAGIIVGYSDGCFKGDRLATRAEIAAVISRIIMPPQRGGHDAKSNLSMEKIQSNLENDSIAVKVGSLYYCLYKYNEDPTVQLFALYAVDGADYTKTLYTAPAGSVLENVSSYNGKVYFCQSESGTNNGLLLCYDPATGKVSTVYDGFVVDAYCFYDGRIYALCLTDCTGTANDYLYAFGEIYDGRFVAFYTGFHYAEVSEFQPYGWMGKIYFKLNSDENETYLYSMDIATRSVEPVLEDLSINTSFYYNHVMYFLAYDKDGNYDRNLYAMSLQAPGVIRTIGEFAVGTNTRYRSLYMANGTYYCLASFSKHIYSLKADGTTRLALMCGGVYSNACFVGNKVILVPNSLTLDNPNELKIYDSKTMSNRTQYGDWLGLSCFYEGARFVPEDGKGVYSTENSVSTVTNLPITVTEAFTRGDDFIVRAKYTNETGETIKLRSYAVKVYMDGVLVAYDVNRMAGIELKDHDVNTFTFVIADADVFRDFDVESGNLSIEIIPTYDIVVVEQQGTTK